MFAFNKLALYATARTLDSKYQYSALKIGLVSVSYGIGMIIPVSITLVLYLCQGCIAGSLLGGRWSDRVFARLKAANGDVSNPEASNVRGGRRSLIQKAIAF